VLLMCTVNIKWGKEKFEDVDCNTDEPPIVFKATLFSLSGVQPDRQKVMYKGVVIKVSFIDLTATLLLIFVNLELHHVRLVT